MDGVRYDGLWWDPREPEKKWVGTLRFNQNDGAVLSITVPTEQPDLFPALRSYDVILGVTTTAKAVTLFRCFDRLTRGAWPGVPRRTEIFANSLIVGFHCGLEPLIETASVSFRNLDAWWGRSAIDHDASARWPDVLVRYAQPAPIVVHDSEAFKISLRSALTASTQRYSSSIREEIRLEIQATHPMPLREFQRLIQVCGDLFSIACLTVADIDTLVLSPPAAGGERPQLGTFHAVPVYKRRAPRSPAPSDFLFGFADIQEHPQRVFGAWLASAERLRRARALYFSGAYGQGFIEGKLLAFTQAAEALHRRLYPGAYMQAMEFEQLVFEPLSSAIPVNIDPSLRQALTARLKFGNEYSLRRRLKALIVDHEAALSSVVWNPREFIDLIVDHRNEFTHHPDARQEPEPDLEPPERLLQFNYLVRCLLEMCFLKAMAFTPEEIGSLARRCETYKQIATRFFPKVQGAVDPR